MKLILIKGQSKITGITDKKVIKAGNIKYLENSIRGERAIEIKLNIKFKGTDIPDILKLLESARVSLMNGNKNNE